MATGDTNVTHLLTEEVFIDRVNGLKDSIDNIAAIEAGKAIKEGALTIVNPRDIQKIVRLGLADKYFCIGDQIGVTRGSATLYFDIIGIDHDKPADPNLQHSLTLQLHDCLMNLQFCSRQALFYAETEMAAGTYHFNVTQHSWVSSDVGKTFQFTLPNAVPAGGQIVLAASYDVTISNSTCSTYASSASTETIDTGIVITEGSDGTDLGAVNNAINGNTNSLQRALLGSNNYEDSAMRQFLNSSAAAGAVWHPVSKFDRAPSWASNTAGFLNGFDEEFISVLGPVAKTTVKNTVSDGGGSYIITDKIWLLSRTEVYGGNEVSATPEGSAYPYYRDYSDLTAAGTGKDTNRIKYLNGSARYWWLRSPNAGYAHYVRRVTTDGAIGYDAFSGSGVAPACCII